MNLNVTLQGGKIFHLTLTLKILYCNRIKQKGTIMKTYIFILLIPFLLCFSGKAMSQVEPEEEVIISKPDVDSADINTFYDELSNSGEWIKVDNQEIDSDESLEMSETVDIDEDVITGYIWRPSVSITLVDWNPYTYGRWEYCNFGWIWVSDYQWGWGPYHYGRWWFSNRWGWVWSPGHRWAPSWVSWCHTRNYVGWHPISPRTHWRHHNGIIVTHPVTPKQKGITNKWTFVDKKDFTKKITKDTKIDLKKNKDLLKDAKMVIKSNEVYNLGPKKTDLEKNNGEKITTKKVQMTNLSGKPINESGTKIFEKKTNTTKMNNNTKKVNNNSIEKNNNNNGTRKKQESTTNAPNTKRENNSSKNTKKNNNSNSNNNTNTSKSGNTKKSNTNDYNWNSGNTKSSNSNSNSTKSNNSNSSRNSNSNNSYKSNNSNSNNHHSSNSNSSHTSKSSSNNNSSKSSNNSGNNSNNSGNKKK